MYIEIAGKKQPAMLMLSIYYSGKFELFKPRVKYFGDSYLRCGPTFSVQSLATKKATSMKT